MFTMLAALGAFAAPTVEDAVYERLLARDFAGCSPLDALGDAASVRDALVRLAASDKKPSYVPMRAATCVVRLAADDATAYAAAKAWLSDPLVPGLALTVVQNLDLMSEERAMELAHIAAGRVLIDERFAAYAPSALQSSHHPQIKAIGDAIAAPDKPAN